MKPMIKKIDLIYEKKGITIVEIVIVILIIAVLAVITVPAVIDFKDVTADRSRTEETQAVVASAKNAIERIHSFGIPIEDINNNSRAAQNFRTRILFAAGASGKIVSFHVSTGENVNATAEAERNPAPKHLDFTGEGTLEFLEYRGSNGNWYGQYRVLADMSPQIRIVNAPHGGPDVTVGND